MKETIIVDGKKINPLAIITEAEDILCIWKDGDRFRYGTKTGAIVVPAVSISKKMIEGLARVAGVSATGEPLVPVQYVGLREKQKEPLYGTGWWDQGQIKKIAMSIATKLLRHPEFKRAGKEGESVEADEVLSGVSEEAEEDKETEAKLQAARDSVANMDLEALKIYAASNFNGFKLHHKASLATARNKVTQLIDQYGVPE